MPTWRYRKQGVSGKHPHFHWATTEKPEEIARLSRLGGFIIEPIQDAKPPKRAIRKKSNKTKKVSK